MNRKSIVMTTMSTVLMTALVACGNGQTQPAPAASSDKLAKDWGSATVSGQKDELKEFDAKLKSILGFDDLNANQIGCVIGCDKFSSPDPLTKIVYVFPRDDASVLLKFAEAWDQVHKEVLSPGFMLGISTYIVSGVCNPVIEPPPCQNMFFCANDQCGKFVAGKPNCTAC